MFLLKARQHSDPSRWIVAITLFFMSIALAGCGTPFSFAVKDENGRPLEGATVLFEPSMTMLRGVVGTTVRRETDSNGEGRVAIESSQSSKLTVNYQGKSYCSREPFWHPARTQRGGDRQIVRAKICGYDENFGGTSSRDLLEVVVEMWCDDDTK